MRNFILLFALLVLASCTKEEDMQGAELLQYKAPTEESRVDPCEFEWNDEAKKFVVDNLVIIDNHCDGQLVAQFDIYLGSGVWETYYFSLNEVDTYNSCIDQYYYDNGSGFISTEIAERN